jgi:hypothetical protein
MLLRFLRIPKFVKIAGGARNSLYFKPFSQAKHLLSATQPIAIVIDFSYVTDQNQIRWRPCQRTVSLVIEDVLRSSVHTLYIKYNDRLRCRASHR